MLLLVFGVVISAAPNIVYAAESTLSYDKTNVLDDLKSSSVNGVPFDIRNYPYSKTGAPRILTFVEYCYSYRANGQDNYGLYVYVYNPQGNALNLTTKQNKIQMAVAYDSNGNATEYQKFNLEFCSRSEGDYNNLFFKFKVVDREINGKTFIDRVNSNERRYDVSGIELVTVGAKNATEYKVGGIYKFTGYAEGFGPDKDAKSTLNCVVEDMETLSLEVHHTHYRTNVSSLGKDHYNEVNTAYFSVPARVFTDYGNLQKIHAEWWEYKTKMATITSNRDYYNQLIKYVGKDVGEYNSSVPVWLYSGYSGQASGSIGSPTIHNFEWVYNKDMSTKYTSFGTVSEINYYNKMSTIMPYVFYSEATSVDGILSFLYTTPPAGAVEGTVVQEYIYNYSNNLGHGYIDVNGRELSKDLFETYVDEGRTMGYNNVNIDLADTFDLNSYDSNHSWWDKLWDYGFSWPSTSGDYKNVAPIYVLEAADLSGSNADIASRLLVNEDDVSALKTYYTTETAKGNKVVLFRFANTDYYCAPAFRNGYSGSIDNTDTYVAQQTVFFDFDIIDLTFNKDGVYTVIPAVSSPTDIINGFTPPASEFQAWKIILAVILLILLLVICYPILLPLLSILLKLILLPFKLIGKLLRGLSKPKRKQKKKREASNDNYERIMREDFPRDFADEDPFTAALLDDIDSK